jgi:hypothetical protein
VKRKPGLGETVKVKKKVAEILSIDLDFRRGVVVDTNSPSSHYDVVVQLLAPNGAQYDISMESRELKRV